MNAPRDLSDLILRRLWDRLAKHPGDKEATARLASEIKRRTDLKMNYGPREASVQIGPDGVLRALPQAAERGASGGMAGEVTHYGETEHKPAGPGGGQFTGPGTGGAAEPAKPKHGERATALHVKHAEMKKERMETWGAVKADAVASKQKAEQHRQKISDDVANISSSDDYPELDKAFKELDELNTQDFDTPADKFSHLKDIEGAARTALQANAKIKAEEGHDKLNDGELAENATRLSSIMSNAQAGRAELKAYVAHRREMNAIKGGEPMQYADGTRIDYSVSDEEMVVYGASRQMIDLAAHDIHPNPSAAQRDAGNHRMGHISLHGLDITIECAKGNRRKPHFSPLEAHYGYIKGTGELGNDGEHIDCFIGPHPQSEMVFVVDQQTPGGRFSEHKVMLAYLNAESAKAGYLANYPSNWNGFGGMKALTMDAFKNWLAKGDTGKRAEPQRIVYIDTDGILRYAEHDESKHPRGEHGRWVEALNKIAHGDLQHVGGLPVRRTKEDEYRIDTDTGHVTGSAAHVAGHIEADQGRRALHGKKREEALERAAVQPVAKAEGAAKEPHEITLAEYISAHSPSKSATTVDSGEKSATIVDTGAKVTPGDNAGEKKMTIPEAKTGREKFTHQLLSNPGKGFMLGSHVAIGFLPVDDRRFARVAKDLKTTLAGGERVVGVIAMDTKKKHPDSLSVTETAPFLRHTDSYIATTDRVAVIADADGRVKLDYLARDGGKLAKITSGMGIG